MSLITLKLSVCHILHNSTTRVLAEVLSGPFCKYYSNLIIHVYAVNMQPLRTNIKISCLKVDWSRLAIIAER